MKRLALNPVAAVSIAVAAVSLGGLVVTLAHRPAPTVPVSVAAFPSLEIIGTAPETTTDGGVTRTTKMPALQKGLSARVFEMRCFAAGGATLLLSDPPRCTVDLPALDAVPADPAK